MSPKTPRAIYQQALAFQRAQLARSQRWLRVVIWSRLLVLLAVVGLAYEACSQRGHSWAGVALAGLLFVVMSVTIALMESAVRRREAMVGYLQQGLARLDGQRGQVLSDGARFLDAAHPYAADLDIFGPDSLFGLLCAARTGIGQTTLARWLTRSSPVAEILERQAAVRDLAERLELRQDLWLAGGVVDKEVREDALERWLAAPATVMDWRKRVAMALLGALGLVIFAALDEPIFIFPGALILIVQRLVAWRQRELLRRVEADVSRRADELRTVARVIGRVQRETFSSPLLEKLRAGLSSEGLPAGKRILQLVRLIDWLESRRNPMFGVLAGLLLLPEQLCVAIEAWRARHGAAAARWLAVIGEMEALCSLATFAFEHPDHPFPKVVDAANEPMLAATALRHPLMAYQACVPNDVRLDRATRLLVVTGSNMSGKSTLLRTVGTNAVLAFAGAPVCAQEMTLTPLQIGASLHAQDSLATGVSRFFAEIQRLHAILSLAGAQPPVIFLLDEILNGTNSLDRKAGAEAVVRQLVNRGCIGIVTTHDLALVELAEPCGGVNVHFEDSLQADRLVFDYRMRPGVVTRRNALDLMRLVGIEVSESKS